MRTETWASQHGQRRWAVSDPAPKNHIRQNSIALCHDHRPTIPSATTTTTTPIPTIHPPHSSGQGHQTQSLMHTFKDFPHIRTFLWIDVVPCHSCIPETYITVFGFTGFDPFCLYVYWVSSLPTRITALVFIILPVFGLCICLALFIHLVLTTFMPTVLNPCLMLINCVLAMQSASGLVHDALLPVITLFGNCDCCMKRKHDVRKIIIDSPCFPHCFQPWCYSFQSVS